VNIKKKVRRAFENTTPQDPAFVCSDAEHVKGSVNEMKKPSKFPRLREFAATAAAIALLICVGLGGAALIKSGFTFGPANVGVGSETTAPTETTAPNETIPEEITIHLPDETPNVVNGVYATCENYNFTYYARHNSTDFGFTLITEKPLPEDAYIVLNDIQSECIVRITADNASEGISVIPQVYWFMQEPDKDWAAHWSEMKPILEEINRLTLQAYGADSRVGATIIDPAAARQLAVEEAKYADLFEGKDGYWKDELGKWKDSNPEPLCYSYNVSIIVKNVAKREQLKSMELIAGDMSRTITMENVWLDVFALNQSAYSCNDVDTQTDWEFPANGYYSESSYLSKAFTLAVANQLPCDSGTYSLHTTKFIPKKDITFKGMYVYGDNSRVKVECAEFLIVDDQGNITKTVWTPGTDVTLHKGEKVAMQIYYKDPYTQLMNYNMNAVTILEYECEGELRQWNLRFFAKRGILAPELYLWAFEGLDMKSYYEDYYVPHYYTKTS